MDNQTLMQYFEWYLLEDGSLWRQLSKEAHKLKASGIDALWLPPAYKGAGGMHDVGYTAYDLYDLGEFDQKGSISTKYGTKEEYLEAIGACKEAGIKVYPDVVLNHKIGADGKEAVLAKECNSFNRNEITSNEEEVEVWTIFDFKERDGAYSDFTWNVSHFDGVDWDDKSKKNAIYLLSGKNWEGQVDDENGNYDYLMGADIDFDNQEVIEELTKWGKWYYDTTGCDGFRLDAVKHIKAEFYKNWILAMREHAGKDLFVVGEYWHKKAEAMEQYLSEVDGQMSLFDVPLHFNFYYASKDSEGYDLTKILSGSLVGENPAHAVTFVDNHDTQLGQALESFVEPWFKPLAYCITLLREGGYPAVFYGDWKGIPHDNISSMGDVLEHLLEARKKYAYGQQQDYFDDAHCIGWTRSGDEEHVGSGLVVLLSSKGDQEKKMCVGLNYKGKTFHPFWGYEEKNIVIDQEGYGIFPVHHQYISIWIQK